MKVKLAASAGFCTGVQLAVKKALAAAAKYPGKVYMLGDIVHNEMVVEKIDRAGVKVVQKITAIPKGSVILLRAHGAEPNVYKQARARRLKIIDATCPLVAEIHKAAKEFSRQGRQVVIIGDHGHDEVVAIAGQVKNPVIVATASEVAKLPSLPKIGVVVQSTQKISRVQEIMAALLKKSESICFVNTICRPTRLRQAEMQILPSQNDVIIVIGSGSSANTKRLVEISRRQNPKTYRVLTAADLQARWFRKAQMVGVTAGASTPPEAIRAVVTKLKQIK
jgi:4-hydroxy-3-methylbut-2-en-1-yl diphosphate reductase